ncbi:MAG: bifunctional ornithine acetyltransferase/N-acetylglutamate synthase, partial [Pseudomonadales bacterium]|nr:bifunctional ornithine acetyltransferase/N-acetylglutamate synthase [Pseudomonadales bacterium]
SQLISCTGVIGVSLPMDIVGNAIDGVAEKLQACALEQAAVAILTTDKQAKMASVEFDGVTLCGFAKGAGMIEPNMATMLSYFFTDVKIDKTDLDQILKRAVDKTFNAISVDSDTSTSDTVAIFSTNEKTIDEVGLQHFERALTALCLKLARDIIGQAEGANQVIEAKVSLSTSYEDARLFTKKIINSPLIKTAVYGRDPNWGRIVMAVGKPSDRETLPEIQPADVLIKILGQTVFEYGHQIPLDLEALSARMGEAKTVDIEVEIGRPVYTAKAWGCDLSEGYIKINAEYTT